MKRSIQLILLVWFIAMNGAILVPSYQLLFGSGEAETPKSQPPAPPPRPTLNGALEPKLAAQQVEVYKQQVTAYVEQIKGYTQELTAHKAYAEAQEKSGRRGVYELVVKGSLIMLFGSFATTLIGYVFVNLGARVIDNMIRVRNGHAPQSLTLL